MTKLQLKSSNKANKWIWSWDHFVTQNELPSCWVNTEKKKKKRCTFTPIKVLSVVSDTVCDGWAKILCQHASNKVWKAEDMISFSPWSLFFPPMFSSITLSQVLHSSPRAVRPESGEQMRNKWVLSGTHEGGRYAYQGFSGGLYPTHLGCPRHSCDFNSLPSSSSSLPAILSEECGNAARPGMERQAKRGEGRGRM